MSALLAILLEAEWNRLNDKTRNGTDWPWKRSMMTPDNGLKLKQEEGRVNMRPSVLNGIMAVFPGETVKIPRSLSGGQAVNMHVSYRAQLPRWRMWLPGPFFTLPGLMIHLGKFKSVTSWLISWCVLLHAHSFNSLGNIGVHVRAVERSVKCKVWWRRQSFQTCLSVCEFPVLEGELSLVVFLAAWVYAVSTRGELISVGHINVHCFCCSLMWVQGLFILSDFSSDRDPSSSFPHKPHSHFRVSSRDQPTTAQGPNLARCLFLWIRFYGNPALLIHFASGCVNITVAVLNGCRRDHMACEVWSSHYLDLVYLQSIL